MKPKLSVPTDEQEMHINYCPAEMSRNCEIYSTIPWVMRYLETLVTDYPDECRLVKDDQYSYTISVPFMSVKPRRPRKIPEEQKRAAAERLADYRKKMEKKVDEENG